jgi:hypothetical protein
MRNDAREANKWTAQTHTHTHTLQSVILEYYKDSASIGGLQCDHVTNSLASQQEISWPAAQEMMVVTHNMHFSAADKNWAPAFSNTPPYRLPRNGFFQKENYRLNTQNKFNLVNKLYSLNRHHTYNILQ